MARAPAAAGTWQDGRVLVERQADADRLADRALGTPADGATRWLTPVEAAFAVEQDRLRVHGPDGPMDAAAVLAAAPSGRAEVEALAYHDLRERGLLVRPAEEGYDVWPRGEGVRAAPWFRMQVAAATDAPLADRLARHASDEDVIAVVDDEGGITHYQASLEDPLGRVPAPELPGLPARLLRDRVLVHAPDAVRALRRHDLGSPFGRHQVLGLGDAHRLADRLRLDAGDGDGAGAIDPRGDAAGVRALLASRAPEAAARVWPVQEALAAAGVHTRSGLRFGTDLRGYHGRPGEDHAAWLFQCALPDEALPWPQLARGVRLAHGVRKAFLVAVAAEPVRYVRLDWFRP